MNKQFSKKLLQFKSIKSVTPIKPTKSEQSYSNKNSMRNKICINHLNNLKNTKCTPTKIQRETSEKEVLGLLKEKQCSDKLQKMVDHKDQIIANKNIKIKQLEIQTKLLKSQLEKYKIKIQQLTVSLETNNKHKIEIARTLCKNHLNCLVYNYLRENGEHDEEEDGNEQEYYPDPDTMTYEELLELENKMGYVSKGLKPEDIEVKIIHNDLL